MADWSGQALPRRGGKELQVGPEPSWDNLVPSTSIWALGTPPHLEDLPLSSPSFRVALQHPSLLRPFLGAVISVHPDLGGFHALLGPSIVLRGDPSPKLRTEHRWQGLPRSLPSLLLDICLRLLPGCGDSWGGVWTRGPVTLSPHPAGSLLKLEPELWGRVWGTQRLLRPRGLQGGHYGNGVAVMVPI